MRLSENEQAAGFKELEKTFIFHAQLDLEDKIIQDVMQKLTSLDIKNPALSLEYSHLQGMIQAIKTIQSVRQNKISEPSRSNSVNKLRTA